MNNIVRMNLVAIVGYSMALVASWAVPACTSESKPLVIDGYEHAYAACGEADPMAKHIPGMTISTGSNFVVYVNEGHSEDSQVRDLEKKASVHCSK